MKKYFIIIIVIFININIALSNSICNSYSTPSESYVFVTQWGSDGEGDSLFGSFPLFLIANWFQITDKTIETLEKKFDEKKLNTLRTIRNKEFKRDEFIVTLQELSFNDEEIWLILPITAIDKPEDNNINGPSSIAVDSSGNIYVADSYNNRIQKFSSDGNFITKWGSKGTGDGQFKYPAEITVDSEGYIYILDSYNRCIQKFDSNGKFILKWGSLGDKDDQFTGPRGIAVDNDRNVLIIDNRYIKKFDTDGRFINKWLPSKEGLINPDIHLFPDSYAFYLSPVIDSFGNIFMIHVYGGFALKNNSLASGGYHVDIPCIVKYNSSYEVITKWGVNGSEDGQFQYPSHISIDKLGNIFVADTGNNRIQKFDSNGKFITQWGAEGSGVGQFYKPSGVTVDKEGNVYVMDTGNYRIQKFAPKQKED